MLASGREGCFSSFNTITSNIITSNIITSNIITSKIITGKYREFNSSIS